LPQEGHLPNHFGDDAPQFWQTKCVFTENRYSMFGIAARIVNRLEFVVLFIFLAVKLCRKTKRAAMPKNDIL